MSNNIDDDRIRTLVRFVWRNHSVNCVTTIAKSLIEVYKTAISFAIIFQNFEELVYEV